MVVWCSFGVACVLMRICLGLFIACCVMVYGWLIWWCIVCGLLLGLCGSGLVDLGSCFFVSCLWCLAGLCCDCFVADLLVWCGLISC